MAKSLITNSPCFKVSRLKPRNADEPSTKAQLFLAANKRDQRRNCISRSGVSTACVY